MSNDPVSKVSVEKVPGGLEEGQNGAWSEALGKMSPRSIAPARKHNGVPHQYAVIENGAVESSLRSAYSPAAFFTSSFLLSTSGEDSSRSFGGVPPLGTKSRATPLMQKRRSVGVL